MPSGFKTFGEEEFDRVFIKETEIIDRFVGNRLWTWGANYRGVLGTDNYTSRSSPGTTAGGGVNWASVSICPKSQDGYGGRSVQAAGIKTDGTLWTWGDNYIYGSLGDGTTTRRSSPGTVAGGGTTWKQVSVGSGFISNQARSHMAAIKTDGTLWTWGDNYNGVLADGTTTARSSPGTTTGGGSNWKQVSLGISRTNAAIKTDGTLWTWGTNDQGQLGTGDTTARSSPGTVSGGGTTWKQVSCGDRNIAAIKTDGTLWTWGNGGVGQLGNSTTTNRSSPGTVSGGGTTWKQVSNGLTWMAAVKTDGTLWTWGSNGYSNLGDGTNIDRLSPVQISGGGTTWKQVQAHEESGYAIKTDGTLWTWGYNTFGQLGTGNTTARSSPGTTLGNSTWKSITAGRWVVFGIAD
jgi:alpha-tubulin suppressor-like RCC1 family protein